METLEQIDDAIGTLAKNNEIADIYEQTFPLVAKYIGARGGSFEDTKDIFHDALILFIEKRAESPEHTITSNSAYILGISKHLWIRKSQKNGHSIPMDHMESQIAIPDDYFPTTNNRRLLHFLRIAGERCLDLLRSFYFQQFSLKEMASSLGYANEHSVSVQKYKCLEKLRNTVKEKSLTYDDFSE
ncbi:MAG: sigma-70 family RNA polymerase sigma factor [Flavobacteriia bacterium]|nr:MAG: sigma-70 family RNA polymerase sigma factor [Flavobacteriia bacterium]